MTAALLAAALLLTGPGLAGAADVAKSGVRYTVNFDDLRLLNDQVVGWLYQEGTGINDPVSRGDDNKYYLKRAFNKTNDYEGSLFLDCFNSADWSDKALTIFGYHVVENELFSSFPSYAEQSYYNLHPSMLLMSPAGDYQVDLFGYVETTMRDGDSWQVPTGLTDATLAAWLGKLKTRSLITPKKESLPTAEDQILTLVAISRSTGGGRYVLYGRLRKTRQQGQSAADVTKLAMDQRVTENGYVTINGVGTYMVYAQNDPLWSDLRFEASGSSKTRRFGQGGCGPTAAAMAVVNLVGVNELPILSDFASETLGYTFCTCSVNNYRCNHRHVQYRLSTSEEFLRYMPLAVASFASGNNAWHVVSRGTGQGTNMRFLDELCTVYGIGVTTTRVAAEAIQMLKEGEGKRVVLCCATRGSPFSKTGHFVVMVAVKDGYVYFLDPLRRTAEEYDKVDRFGFVEVIAPGVVRIAEEKAATVCNLSPHYILERNTEEGE